MISLNHFLCPLTSSYPLSHSPFLSLSYSHSLCLTLLFSLSLSSSLILILLTLPPLSSVPFLSLPTPPLPAVILDVDNSSLESQYQSFASLMEQRLAELFVVARQQGTRFRRATTVDSYTVQVGSRAGTATQAGWPLLGID